MEYGPAPADVPGMQLHRRLVALLDPAFGDFAERDLASYHVPVCADVPALGAHALDEEDPHLNPMGSMGSGRSASWGRRPRSRTPSTTRWAYGCGTCP